MKIVWKRYSGLILTGGVRKQLSEHVADSSSFRAAVHVRLFELSHEGTR